MPARRNRRSRRTCTLWQLALATIALASWCAAGNAQELTPRAYWPAPKGTRLAIAGYAYIDGSVLFDPSIPLYEVETRANTALIGYLQTFSLFGRSSNVLVKLPYVWGETQGFVETTPEKRSFSNFGDLSVVLAINLIGAPSMSVEDFPAFRAEPRPILGMSVEVVAPTGNYHGSQLINTGGQAIAGVKDAPSITLFSQIGKGRHNILNKNEISRL